MTMSNEEQNTFPEAPASNTFKVKSVNGFEHLFTMRDVSVKDLIVKIETIEKAFLDKGWTPLAQQPRSNGFPPKQVDFVEGRVCPTCSEKLVHTQTKEGKKFIKCSTNRWDFATKTAIGCKYIEWPEMTQADL